MPGGLYGYEQQQNMWSSVNHPLMQPYAAYTGGEFATIAIENVVGRLVGGPIVRAVASAAPLTAGGSGARGGAARAGRIPGGADFAADDAEALKSRGARPALDSHGR